MACVQEADTADDIRRLADLAAKGDLGRPELWKTLEEDWLSNGIPLTAFSKSPFDDPPNSLRPALWSCYFKLVDLNLFVQDCLDQCYQWPTSTLAEVLVRVLASGPERVTTAVKPVAFRALVGVGHYRPILDAIPAAGMQPPDREEWLSVCEDLGPIVKGPWCRKHTVKLSQWIEAELAVNNQRPGLLPFLAGYMQHAKGLGSGLGRRWLTLDVDARFSWALAIVQLGLADLEAQDATQLAPRVVEATRHDPSVLDAITKILADRHSGSEFLGAFALKAFEISQPQDFLLREAMMKILDDEVRRRVSGWADPATQNRLGLFE
jgi:hypothetical protein